MRTRKEIRRVTSTIKLTVWSARYIGNPRRLLRVCGDRVRKGWWCTPVARPLFELDSETKPTGRPCRPPSLRHRPRRIGSARLAQETEGCRLIFLTSCKKKAAQIIARPRPRPLGSGGNVWRSPQGRACSSVRKLLLRFGNRGAGSGKQPPDQNT